MDAQVSQDMDEAGKNGIQKNFYQKNLQLSPSFLFLFDFFEQTLRT